MLKAILAIGARRPPISSSKLLPAHKVGGFSLAEAAMKGAIKSTLAAERNTDATRTYQPIDTAGVA